MRRRLVSHGTVIEVHSAGPAGPHTATVVEGTAAAGDDAAAFHGAAAVQRTPGGDVMIEVDGLWRRVRASVIADRVWVDQRGRRQLWQVQQASRGRSGGAADSVVAPMTGRVVLVQVQPGDAVRRGQPLVVVEAMKMEQPLAAPRDGVVEAVGCRVGDLVDGGVELVRLRRQEAP